MGVEYEHVSGGDGATYAAAGDEVRVHYTGRLTDGGKQFDTSFGREPFEVVLGKGMVIKCWDEGLTRVSLGEKATLVCTPDYGYGKRGAPPAIPPNASLTFEVEMVAINGVHARNEDGQHGCAGCGRYEDGAEKFKACAACRRVCYCCREHQVAHWRKHKRWCKRWKAEREAAQSSGGDGGGAGAESSE